MAQKNINFKLILKFLGILIMITSGFMLLSMAWSVYFNETDTIKTLLISSAITFGSGFALFLVTRQHDHRFIAKKEGYLIVTLTWVSITFFGTIPFSISGYIPNYSDAFFETMSGFTTTGATILNDIEALPKGLLFWRAITHWLGGMGIIVMTLAVLPILGVGGMQLYVAEAPGTTPNRLHPRIAETAKRLWGIYVLFTLIQTALLMAGGMNLFHSLSHAFSTMATGGFSTQNDSIAGYSAYIQYVIIGFMILAGMNFSLHYFALKGQLNKVFENDELKFYLTVIAGFAIVLTVAIFLLHDTALEKAFRDSLFQTVSIITTTGFITSNYLQWDGFLWFFIFILMFTGACIGSTSGGIKMIRLLVLVKNTRQEFKRLIHPMAVIPVRVNNRTIDPEIIHNFLAFFFLYITFFFVGAAIMTFFGLDFSTAIGASIATIGNIGPAIGTVGPADTYANIPDLGKWILSFYMLLGRLELFTVLLIFSPSFWKS